MWLDVGGGEWEAGGAAFDNATDGKAVGLAVASGGVSKLVQWMIIVMMGGRGRRGEGIELSRAEQYSRRNLEQCSECRHA